MGKKQRRLQAEAEHARLLSRELDWLERSTRHRRTITFGAPVHCPTDGCSDFGLVESMAQGRQHNRCWSCGLSWTLSTQAMALFAQACVAPVSAQVVGAGTLVANLEPAEAARTTRERIVGVFHLDVMPPLNELPSY